MFDLPRFFAETVVRPKTAHSLFTAFRLNDPAKSAVRKRFLRGKTPGEWLALLLAMRELEREASVSVEGYSTKGAALSAQEQ